MKNNTRSQDLFYLNRALELAKKGAQQLAGGPFGCVIVKNDEIIGEGHNEVLGSHDPTAHAEVVAIRRACAQLNDFQLSDCTVYATCEPCPMCLGALYWARPARIVYACTREEAADIGFDDAFIYREIDIDPAQRSLPATHVPMEEASLFMKSWGEQESKSMY